jgi:hypothetical protein
MVGKGVAQPSPPHPLDVELVRSFIEASQNGDETQLREVTASGWLQSNVAASCVEAIATIEKACDAEPLYLLGDNEIRQSWVCGDMVPFQAYFTLEAQKITNVWASDTTRPIQVGR